MMMREDSRMQIAALCTPSNSGSDGSGSDFRFDALSPPQLHPPVSPPLSLGLDALASLDAAIAFHRRQQQKQQHQSSSTEHTSAPPPSPTLFSFSSPSSSSSSSTSAPKKRSMRMSNSTRGKLYRSRRKKYTDGLGERVEALRKEVEDLELYRHTQRATLYHSRHLAATSPCARVVCEYFSLFEFGVPVVAESITGGSGSGVAADVLARSLRQAGFLDSMMSPEIEFGGARGVQMLLEQWERYSMYHTKLQFVLQRLDIVVPDAANAVVSAKAVLRVRLSRLTIQKVFPHVLWNEALVQRLIGLEIDYPVGNTFYFGRDGKIHGYETEVDFIAAFTRALGSIQDSLELVSHALIKQQHMIGEDTGGDDDSTRSQQLSSSSPSSSSNRTSSCTDD